MRKIIDPFTASLRTIDVHGEREDTVMTFVNDFINDAYILKEEKIMIIHGHGGNVLKNKIHNELKHNKKVKNYYLNNLNIGCTIVELNLR